jgi:hypothetical protein
LFVGTNNRPLKLLRLSCGFKYGQTRLTYNVSDAAAAGIVINPGKAIDFMQVFHCTCPTNNVSFFPTSCPNFNSYF